MNAGTNRVILGLLLAVGLAGGCSVGRTTRTETVDAESSSVGSSISLHGNSAKASLDRGKQYVLDGNFTQAVGEFQEAYSSPGAAPELRAEALFELGEAYANVLNPWKDREKAIGYFRKLQAEFPDSKFAKEAAENLELLESSK